MNRPPRQVLSSPGGWPLHDSAATREIELAASRELPAHALMQRAGAAVARMALAMAPHAGKVHVLCGPGNNGGDGLVAARLLHLAGRAISVTLLADPQRLPPDAAQAHTAACEAGVPIERGVPRFDDCHDGPGLVIDALLGLGQARPIVGDMANTVAALAQSRVPVLAVDVPTGLCADTGRALGEHWVHASVTLSLLTLKPGLFTGQGRDAAGEVWWDDLGAAAPPTAPVGRLAGAQDARDALAARVGAAHRSHKGSFGDVWVIGGAPGMAGAALLAATASLHAGAGRVFVCTLGEQAALHAPELMLRNWAEARATQALDAATVVCGCGGGDAVSAVLPEVIHQAARLVLDADALNAVAGDAGLAKRLRSRGLRGQPTVLTPHPLEAARLLGTTVSELQGRRWQAAQDMAERFHAVVVLKGSGSVIAAPGTRPLINPSGNARLATPGSGDVLAGWLGGCWSSQLRESPSSLEAASMVAAGCVWLHGRAVEPGPGLPLPASRLIDAMAQAASALG
ncbi:MAG: NAD(P)H-hydrate dehydratase [Vitreoscilla sp.]|nr:NAD(P)H-hydrate dehydratase [Vitreoscilla sp.]